MRGDCVGDEAWYGQDVDTQTVPLRHLTAEIAPQAEGTVIAVPRDRVSVSWAPCKDTDCLLITQ